MSFQKNPDKDDPSKKQLRHSVDVELLRYGKKLQEVYDAKKKGILTESQQQFLDDAQQGSKTLNRDALSAFKCLCKMKAVESWVAKTLEVAPPKTGRSHTFSSLPVMTSKKSFCNR
jgi:translation initiation factor 2 beta subunit (eIF-2beta)/eIF-5